MGYDLARLELRRWRVADALRLTAAHADPDMANQGGIRDTATAVDWIGRVADLGNGHVYAVADADDHPVGCVAVTNIDRHQVGWTWYWTIAEIRGRGVARDALRALADWAHHDAGLYRLELGHRLNNPASCAWRRAPASSTRAWSANASRTTAPGTTWNATPASPPTPSRPRNARSTSRSRNQAQPPPSDGPSEPARRHGRGRGRCRSL
jgi:ribosomal-protein-alanine N-acetyltransferase